MWWKTGVLGVGLLVLEAGCGRVIINQPVDRRGDSWDLILRRLKDGPNQYRHGNIDYYPGENQRFIWVNISLHNSQPVPRTFNFDRCDLDDGEQRVVPSLIDFDWIFNGRSSREPELAPNETITRNLIFTYPKDRSPTRLACAPMVIPLPQF